jgi:hypothetical protein
MTPEKLSEDLEMAAVNAGTAHQTFYQDGWKFLVEPNLERNGYQVKLEFLFFHEFFIAANQQRRYRSRMEHTAAVNMTGLEDQLMMQNIARALIAEAEQFARAHTPTEPSPE